MKICGVDFGLTTCFAVIDFSPNEVKIIDIQNYNLLHDSIEDKFLLWTRLRIIHEHISDLVTQYKFDIVGVESAENKGTKPYQLQVLLEKDQQSLREFQTKSPYFQQIIESFNFFTNSVWAVGREFEFETFIGRKISSPRGRTEAYGKILFQKLVEMTGLKGRDMRDAVAVAIALGCFYFDCAVPKNISNEWLVNQGFPFYTGRRKDVA